MAFCDASAETLNALLDLTPLAIAEVDCGTLDPATRWPIVRWSRQAEQLFGLPADRVLGLEIADLQHPEDRHLAYDNRRTAVGPGKAGVVHARLVGGDGVTRHCEFHWSIVRDERNGRYRALNIIKDVSEAVRLRRAEAALRASEARYRAIVETSLDAIVVIDERGVIQSANPAATGIFGYGAPELVGRNVKILMAPGYAAAHEDHLQRYGQTGERQIIGIGRTVEGRRKDGTVVPLDLQIAEWWADGRRFFTGTMRDITARIAAERRVAQQTRELEIAHHRLQRHVENTPLAVLEFDCSAGPEAPWPIRLWSGQAEALFGWTAAEACDRTAGTLGIFHPEEDAKHEALRRELLGGDAANCSTVLHCRTKRGSSRHCRAYLSVVSDAAGLPATCLVFMEDISETVLNEERIRTLAHHDPLTGLPNRRLFSQRLREALQASDGLGLLLFDLDHFKVVNDTLGHPGGDSLLRQVAGRIACLRSDGEFTWARLGGDEFACLVYGANSEEQLGRLADELLETLREPFEIEGQRIDASASVGITIVGERGATEERLLRNADIALYRAKSSGRDGWMMFEPEMEAEVITNASLQRDLRRAIHTQELTLAFQPVAATADGSIDKVEALLRWQRSDGSHVPPAIFIPIAESSGLIHDLGRFVQQAALDQLAAWRARDIRTKIAINTSVLELRRPTFVVELEAMAVNAGVPLSALILEITEGVFLDPSKEAIFSTLRQLGELGCQLCIDDFGTGYSSLAYIKHYPFHTIKIDGTFVRDIGRDSKGEAVILAVLALARQLGLTVVGERVETEEQRDFLLRHGCDLIQGYLVAKAVSPAQLETLPGFGGRDEAPALHWTGRPRHIMEAVA